MDVSRIPPMAIPAASLASAALALVAGLWPLAPLPGPAQEFSPNQPSAIQATPGLPPPSCRLVVPRREQVLQPLRIAPAQVARKNAMGCLSTADAFYSPDGCPSQLCGKKHGTRVPLP